jgi:uncharacterized protein YunC (DUF1805 family)
MEYAARRPTLPSRRSLVAPLVALVVGAGAAIGGYALLDDDTAPAPPDVIVVEQPGPGQGVRGVDDMANAPSVSVEQPGPGQGVRGVDDMANAPSESVGPQTGEAAIWTDPHGPGHALHR